MKPSKSNPPVCRNPKTLYGFNTINVTLGLPFIRISPDHGPNVNMLGKNKSNPNSLIESIRFFEKYGI